MKIIITKKYLFTDYDFKIIKEQIKEKHIKLVNIARELGISRSYLSDILCGRRYAPITLINKFISLGIIVPFSELIDIL